MNRQLYQMGGMGIESLSPMQPAMQPAMQSAMYNPLEENYYSGMPMMMAGGGIANLVPREKYGIGSSFKKALKSFAKTFIPKELDPVLQFAAPFLGPVYGPIASVAGSARTGKINPFTLAASTLPYVQFGGEGATGLGSFMPVGYGGSGAIELPGGALQLGQKGTSLASSLGKYFDIGSTPYSEQGQGTVSKIFSTINPGSTLTGSERIANIMDLGKQATDAILYKTDPVTGKQVLDKRAAFSIAMSIPSYLDAKKKADELGLSSNEFNEQIYNQEKEFYQKSYQSNLPMSSFGITPPPVKAMAQGGMMNDAEGILSIKLTPAQGMAMGGEIPVRKNQGGVSELDLRAKGGYIPVGIKEKADDVPAMLSKNEFVFTADAVRGAGNGSVNKGAQKMYKLMKSLEKKVKQNKVA
jgi:hypothetical protein